MVWGSSDLKSCSKLLARIESNDPNLTDLVILPPPLKVFTSQDAKRLADVLTRDGRCKLKGLVIPHDLSGCLESITIIGSSLVADGINNNGLKELDLGNDTFGDTGANSLSEGIERRRKEFPKSTTSLVTINLARKGLTGQGMEALGSALSPSIFIQNIDLSGNSGAILFCSSALKKIHANTNEKIHVSPFPCLETINLSNCSIGKAGETNHLSESLGDLLEATHCDSTRGKNCKQELNLSENNIFLDPTIIQQIAHLIGNGALTKLDISSNLIQSSPDSIRTIANSLKSENCRLSSLKCSNCGIDAENIKILASILPENKSLRELDLSNNSLGDEGVEAIASALGVGTLSGNNPNVSLKFLDMSSTNIGHMGAISLLSSNNLNGLRLFGNKIGEDFGKLVGYIGRNNSLNSLDLGGNNCSPEDLLALLNTVRNENDTLTLLEIGGNKTNEEVINAVISLRQVKPKLDVAHDKMPSGEFK